LVADVRWPFVKDASGRSLRPLPAHAAVLQLIAARTVSVLLWPDHKQICAAPANASSQPGSTTQLGVLLGEGFSAKSCQIPRAPLSTAVVRHLFNKHKESRHTAFTDVLMPVSDRLFGRSMRIIYDTQPASRLQPNTFATRDTCNLQLGLGPNIRGQVCFAL